MFTTIARFQEPWEAHIFRARLEAEGIPASVLHEHQVWVNWVYSNALGGVQVQVADEHVAAAQAIEARYQAGEFAADLDAEFDDPQAAPRKPTF